MQELSWRIGGEQGEGIESSGDLWSKVLNSQGYYLYAFRAFSSRIKGGHTHYSLRIANEDVGTLNNKLDFLIAFDKDSLELSKNELHSNSLILVESKISIENLEATVVQIPFTELLQAKNLIKQKGVFALGCSAALLQISLEIITESIEKEFLAKGQEVIEKNLTALKLGYDYIFANYSKLIGQANLPICESRINKLFVLGNEVLALGALVAGARFMAAYPITPSSEIMEYLVKKLPAYGGIVVQTEDEIAACTMAIGAAYAGARALTATSGPGLSLMAEAIGLACMTETPLVVYNTQRGGPSTGLPTKHEQSDILAALYNTHGDTAKIVIAPSSIEESFYDSFEAFNLAEQYQCPVIVLTDLQLSLAKQTINNIDIENLKIERGKLLADKLPELSAPNYFPRYNIETTTGVSPRVLPGTKNGVYLTTGLEHDIYGKPSENKTMRVAQSEKRLKKLENFLQMYSKATNESKGEDVDLLIIGVGATLACIKETEKLLAEVGITTRHMQIRLLAPFPVKKVSECFKGAKKIVVLEHNATGQLKHLIRGNVENCPEIKSILQYDGDIITPQVLKTKCMEVLANDN